MYRPKTYRSWLKTTGQSKEFGTKATVLDKMVKEIGESQVIDDIVVPLLSKAIANGLLNVGARLPGLETWEEPDASLRGHEYGCVLEAIQGKLPIEYLNLSYHAWQKGYDEIRAWETKELWEYLYYWWLRMEGRKKMREKVESLLDELKPCWRD